MLALGALHGETRPFKLQFYCAKTEVQASGRLLVEAMQSLHACDKDTEMVKSILVAKVDHANKSFDGLALRTLLWTRQEYLALSMPI